MSEKNGWTKWLRLLPIVIVLGGLIGNACVTVYRVDAQEKAYAMTTENVEKNENLSENTKARVDVLENQLKNIEGNQRQMMGAAVMFQVEYKKDMRYLAELIKNGGN